jgi:addiction module HigA family antidote
MTITDAASALHVARVTLSKILNGNAGISAEMSLRLAKWLGTSPDLWMDGASNSVRPLAGNF